jgi:opacity protein-like surface antigen
MNGIKIALSIIISVITSIFALPALATGSQPSGWYFEGNIGESRTSLYTGNSIANSGFAWNINAGYKFMPYVAAEAGYTSYSTASIKSTPNSGSKIGENTAYSYDFAAKGILPVNDSGLNLFGKLGAAVMKTHIINTNPSVAVVPGSGTHNSISLYCGLGVEYFVISNVALNMQWARANGNDRTSRQDLFSAGLSYVFM